MVPIPSDCGSSSEAPGLQFSGLSLVAQPGEVEEPWFAIYNIFTSPSWSSLVLSHQPAEWHWWSNSTSLGLNISTFKVISEYLNCLVYQYIPLSTMSNHDHYYLIWIANIYIVLMDENPEVQRCYVISPGHPASGWQSRDSDPCGRAPESPFSVTMLCTLNIS